MRAGQGPNQFQSVLLLDCSPKIMYIAIELETIYTIVLAS